MKCLRDIYGLQRVIYLINLFYKVKIIWCLIEGYVSVFILIAGINTLQRFTINKDNTLNYSTLINKGSFEYLNFKQNLSITHKVLNYSRDICLSRFCDLLILILHTDFDKSMKLF